MGASTVAIGCSRRTSEGRWVSVDEGSSRASGSSVRRGSLGIAS